MAEACYASPSVWRIGADTGAGRYDVDWAQVPNKTRVRTEGGIPTLVEMLESLDTKVKHIPAMFCMCLGALRRGRSR